MSADERYPLGKPIRPEPIPKGEVVEQVKAGVYRIDGKLETFIVPTGPRRAPEPADELPIVLDLEVP